MSCETEGASKAVKHRYWRQMATAGGLYILAVIGGALLVRHTDPPQWALILIALAPLAPAFLILRAILIFIRSVDEFQRRVHGEAIMLASGAVALLSFAYGMLEEWAHFPHLPLIWVLPVLLVAWSIARGVLLRLYK